MLEIPHTPIVHGDARCFSIACASIIAKVTRDRLMAALARRYEGYRWERNVGYATADHIAGLTTRGITPHHRRSFFRVSQLSLDLDAPSSPLMWQSGEGPIPAAALEIVLADVARSSAASDDAFEDSGPGAGIDFAPERGVVADGGDRPATSGSARGAGPS